MPHYPKEIYLQNNLRLTEKKRVRNDARLIGNERHAGMAPVPNYSIPLLEWLNERIKEGDVIFPGLSESPIIVNDSSSIDFTTSGVSNHTLTGVVKISGNAGNQLSILSNGLFVPQVTQTPLTVVDSSRIDFSVSGINNHTLTGNLIMSGLISNNAGNNLTLGTDGNLFVNVPESTSFSCSDLNTCSLDNLGTAVTSINGITGDGKASTPIKLGAVLTQNTSFTGNYDFYFGNKNYIFGDDNTLIGTTSLKFAHKLTKSLNSLSQGFSTNFKNSIFTIDTGFSLGAGTGLFNDNNLTRLYVNNSKTIAFSAKAANQSSYVQFRGVGTSTLTMGGNSGNIGVYANHLAYTQLDNDTDDAANKAKITHYANYHSLITAQNVNHNEISNFYHLFLADSTNNLATPAYITNKYGVYQEGALDKNVFFGDVNLGTTTFTTSAKLKIESTTQGFLPPRMTSTQKNAISSPAEGLIVYDTTLHKLCVRTSSSWETITSA